jgi:hypothetical protein
MSICAVLIAQACNVGYKPLVNENVPASRLERLKYIARQGPQRENWCSPKRTAYRCLQTRTPRITIIERGLWKPPTFPPTLGVAAT